MIIYLKNIVNTAALVCFCFFIGLSIISLSVEEGEIFGLLGPNSSGKPPTMNCILKIAWNDIEENVLNSIYSLLWKFCRFLDCFITFCFDTISLCRILCIRVFLLIKQGRYRCFSDISPAFCYNRYISLAFFSVCSTTSSYVMPFNSAIFSAT